MVQLQLDPVVGVAVLLGSIGIVLGALSLLLRSAKSIVRAGVVIGFSLMATGAIIKSGASSDLWSIDATSKAGRTTDYDSAGREVSFQSKQTYSCSNTFTPAATPTDLITLTGSATKTIRVYSMYLATTNTAAGSQQYFVIKRSTADTTGTFVTTTPVPHDSNDSANTATCGHYTANPGALGTAVGTVNTVRWASPIVVPTSFAGVAEDAGRELLPWYDRTLLDQPLTLRGTAQQLVVNFNGAALVGGQIHAYRVTFTEE